MDDVAENLMLLEALLEAEDYEVDKAENGKLALAKIETFKPDLVLLDVMMPGMSGLEVTRYIRQNDLFSNIPIMLLTAHDEVSLELVMNAKFNIQAEDLIRKPFDFDKLLARIKNSLNKT
ncbi:MAG TPA: response regulator [Coleofasciculaceae cyanobacterium]